MKRRFDNVAALPGFETLIPPRFEPAAAVPVIVRGFSDAPHDPRPDVDDMTAAELRAELSAHGHDDEAIDRLPNWHALAGAVRKLRQTSRP